MSRPRGRPPKDTAGPSREAMLSIALDHLDTAGVDAFTMRALGERLGVNAMTIYHHFGDRGGLIAAMADHVYASVSAPATGSVVDRIAALMLAYHTQVHRHPSLTLLIFSGPVVFPKQAQRITDDISQLLIDAGMTTQKARLWVAILVDFTHGAAIATAMGGRPEVETTATGLPDGYSDALMELLNGLKGSL